MDRNALATRLDEILQHLQQSKTPISDQDSLRERFLGVYEELLSAAEERKAGLTENDAYFFSRPLYPAYRNLLDKELREFIVLGSAHTLPEDVEELSVDVAALREQLEKLT